MCRCQLPGNPDKTLIGCTTEPCKQWLHEECIKHDALLAAYKRLGTDKPHQSKPAKVEKDEGTRPLSPTEPGAAASAQQSIDVKQNDTELGAVHAGTNGNVEVKGPGGDDAAEPSGEAQTAAQGEASKTGLGTPRQGTPVKVTPAKKQQQKPRKKGPEYDVTKPYIGLFDVSLRMDLSPPLLEFKDLREGIVGGDRTWTEPIKCLVCDAQIN